MEERLIDRDKGNLTLSTEEGEAVLDLPEGEDGEYDEDLVGLTPSRLQEELARRKREEEKARAEFSRLCEAGEAALAADDFEGAEACFAQAALFGEGAEKGLWKARTHGYTDAACFYDEEKAEEFSRESEEVKRDVLDALGNALRRDREAYEAEAAPLRARYEAEQTKRREAFQANRRYYLYRFLVCLCSFLAFAAGSGVSASYLAKTQTVLPIVFAAVLGALALAALCVTLFFSRKLYLAGQLCRANEKPSSTEDGARLAELEQYLRCLAYVLS